MSTPTPQQPPKCWVCGQPSIWTITATRNDDPKTTLYGFNACARCIPFDVPEEPKTK